MRDWHSRGADNSTPRTRDLNTPDHILACQPVVQRRTMVRIAIAATALLIVCSLKAFTASKWKSVKPLFFIVLGLILMQPMLTWATHSGAAGDVATK